MKPIALSLARAVAERFSMPGRLEGLETFERGHIHDTFVSRWSEGDLTSRFLHQRMNADVFRDIPGLMHNVERVTAHLRSKSQARPTGPQALELVPLPDGATWLEDSSGPWRTYRFIEHSQSFDRCRDANLAFAAAHAFGQFQADLADLDPADLRTPLPGFFDAAKRAAELDAAVATDRTGRVDASAPELRAVARLRPLIAELDARLASSGAPDRIVHGDTKLNNVLFDERNGEAMCIVDLDTCMPGWSLYDFGDLVRFTAATCAEDEQDLAQAGTDAELYGALRDGYLIGAGDMLTPGEAALMPLAARVVTLMIGMRFLADHLNGDVYFRARRDGHNLDRARVQLAMVERMQELQA